MLLDTGPIVATLDASDQWHRTCAGAVTDLIERCITTITRLDTLRISKDLFHSVIRENPDAALELIRILASRLANTTAQLTKQRTTT